jgi:bacterioferritin-associated ferredoxin
MIVCHCEVVTDRGIRAAVDDGAETIDDIGQHCAAGTGCGGCWPTIAALLAALSSGEQEQTAA